MESGETPLTWRARLSYLYPQEQSSLVIPSGTGFPLCCLLRLAGLRWRYSNPPPPGEPGPRVYIYIYIYIYPQEQNGPAQSQSHVTTDGQSLSMS
jgi:hypothetical protein